MRHFIALVLALLCVPAAAGSLALVGVIGDKAAVLALDGGDPKTVKVGQTWQGITVLRRARSRDGPRRGRAPNADPRAAPPRRPAEPGPAQDAKRLVLLVIEQGLEIPLLGMSFLNRVEMQRDGDSMTLIRRF